MTPLAAYVLLFVAVGTGFIFVHLLAGKLIRPNRPSSEKGTIYECGEPTIGSAWIQFDLRFYVVALLFVIFDVEVAFFFPWAEVFGKANEVANAPAPREAKDYRALAAKAFDLADPGSRDVDATAPPRADDSKRIREARQWKALSQLTDDQFAAYRRLDEVEPATTIRMLRDLKPATYLALQQLDPTRRAAIRAQGARYSQVIADLINVQKEIGRQFLQLEPTLTYVYNPLPASVVESAAGPVAPRGPQLVVADPLPPGPSLTPEDRLAAEISGRESSLRNGLLSDRLNDRASSLRLFSSWPVNQQQQRERRAPGVTALLDGLAREQHRAFQDMAQQAQDGLLAALTKPGAKEPPPGASADLTGVLMDNLGRFKDEDYDAIKALPQSTLRALNESSMITSARQGARSLAWLALIEVLVFFGVLLVGFAYLWKRGDLAWVRSTLAERPAGLPAGPKPESMELQASGKSS